MGLAITWAAAFLLTEAGVYNYKGCDTNVPASNIVSEHCRKHVSRMKHCRVDTSHALNSSPWFRFPYPLQWGTPVFHWKMAIVMCVVSIISSVDSVSFLSFLMFVSCIFSFEDHFYRKHIFFLFTSTFSVFNDPNLNITVLLRKHQAGLK